MVALAAPGCDERDCSRGGGSTAPTSQPIQPTAAPAVVPTEAPESIQIEPVPTDKEWINRIRTSNGTIIVRDDVIWAPTGAMTWEITENLAAQLSQWFSRHPDPSYPNYRLAAQDWSTIEGHKGWLISLTAAQAQQEEAATSTPTMAPQPTIIPKTLCHQLTEKRAAVLAEYNKIWDQIYEYESRHGEGTAVALRNELNRLGEEYKQIGKELQANGCFGGR